MKFSRRPAIAIDPTDRTGSSLLSSSTSTLGITSIVIVYFHTMFQRTIFRQAQAARSVLTASTSTSAAQLALRRTTRLQSQLPTAMRPFAPQPIRRFYSTENNGEKKEAAQEGESAENAEDPVRKELEEKKKEVTELKVCPSILLQ